MWDIILAFLQEYKYELGFGYLCYIFVNIVVYLVFRIRSLERKLRGNVSCCGAAPSNNNDLPKEATGDNEARDAISEDWVTARLERSTSDPNFHAIATGNADGEKESDQKQESAVDDWRRGIEHIVKIKRLVDMKAEELVENMSFAPGRKLHPFFKDLVKIIEQDVETEKSVADPEKKQASPKVVKSAVKKSAIPTPERKAPFMDELKEKIVCRHDDQSPEKTVKVD